LAAEAAADGLLKNSGCDIEASTSSPAFVLNPNYRTEFYAFQETLFSVARSRWFVEFGMRLLREGDRRLSSALASGSPMIAGGLFLERNLNHFGRKPWTGPAIRNYSLLEVALSVTIKNDGNQVHLNRAEPAGSLKSKCESHTQTGHSVSERSSKTVGRENVSIDQTLSI
jgi:hypothetical protein